MWWKQEPNVTGFVALANTTSKAITAKVDVSDTHASILGSHTVTVPPQGMEMLNLLDLQSASSLEGGIRVSYTGEQDALLISGALEDVGTGYDANIPFAPPAHPIPPMAEAAVPQGIVELGLMAGVADPYMHFPDGTVFTPYSVMRNISTAPISVTPTLWWMQGTAPKSFQLSPFRLLPFETRTIDVPSMLTAAGLKDFSGYANLAFDTQGQAGLLLASGSVDQTYNYSFPVVPRGILPSAKKSIAYWSTGNGDDTMVTMWNPADEVQNFTFRLVYAGGHYDRLITLQPRATYMFSISEIMASPGPDLDGNVIPAGTHEGSAEIVGIEADNQSILVAEDAAIYNVRKATCGGSCQNCDGGSSWSVPISPFGVSIGGYEQENLVSQWCDGNQYNLTGDAVWTTSNGSLATVQTGNVHGVAVGQVTIGASDPSGPICAPQCNPYGSCPAYYGGGGQSQGTVPPQVTFGPLTAVTVGASLPVSVTFSGGASSSSVPITLTISTTTGTGSAVFSTGGTSMTITAPTTVLIKGVTASSTQGNLLLDATISNDGVAQPDATNPQSFTVVSVAIPVNFQSSPGTNQPDGTLVFGYTWQSSSGSLSDLAHCFVYENVLYGNGASPYVWPLPMVHTTNPNPTVIPVPATQQADPNNPNLGGMGDYNKPPDSYQKPYIYAPLDATQALSWECPTYNDGSFQRFVPPMNIHRQVFQDPSDNLWKYQIQKSGYTNTIVIPQ